ncbi:hypothetical protein [uncultured Senegalimassilia sp.]|uniref:hypothetical protein n=1 Tax=uncultured Senegalimassilia sp. TaxID=1714350 RepID=UPI0025E3525C|nr:hypothetical protein [uncultured Senegalimassilia sp.]
MISDQERREVAAKLRGLDEHIDGVPSLLSPRVHNAMALSAIRAVVGKGDIFHLLADLIDRPTTYVDVNRHGRACCANCGCDDWCLADDNARFCPQCGAKVVDK